MPAPRRASVASTAWLELALTAKQIERVLAAEGLGQHVVVALDRRRRIAIERRPDLGRDALKAHALGVEHAVFVAEMMHESGVCIEEAAAGRRP